jgi:hypothetical protein
LLDPKGGADAGVNREGRGMTIDYFTAFALGALVTIGVLIINTRAGR